MAFRVAVIEDRKEIRDGLRMLIDGTPGCKTTAVFRSMEEAIPLIGRDLPDVALVDLGLPGMSGIDGIRELRKLHPALKLLVLTVYEDDERIFDALCAGADGYLLKKTPPARLLEGLQEALDGGAPMSPEVARKVVTIFREVRPPKGAGCDLTKQESEVLRLLVEGHNYKTAADALGITVNTLSFHVRNVYSKLEVHSKSEAVAKALRSGFFR